MSTHWLKCLTKLDLFGVPLMPKINQKESIQRSIVGGIFTLIIICTSIVYSSWVIYKWRTNQLSPKIQHSVYLSKFKELDQNYQMIRISYWQAYEGLIDPFETNIFIPFVQYISNENIISTEALQLSNSTSRSGNRYIIPKLNLGFDIQDEESLLEMYIWLAKCDQTMLQDGQECASEETIQQFYAQPANNIFVEFVYRQLDSKDQSVKETVSKFFIQVEKNLCFTLNTFLQSTLYEINDSILFEPPTYSEYIIGAQLQGQTNSVEYCSQEIGMETYSIIYMVLEGVQTKTSYEYQHASDILANIGSIVSVLFMLQHLIHIINEQFLEQLIFNQIFQMYYPQFKDMKIITNWKGNIKNIFYKSRVLDSEEQQCFEDLLKKVKSKIEIKLSILNMLYEISRLYFLVRSTKQIEEIQKIHCIGIRFNFLKSDRILLDSECKSDGSSQEYTPKFKYLNEEDLAILSLNQKDFILKQDKIPDEIDDGCDYYNINKI